MRHEKNSNDGIIFQIFANFVCIAKCEKMAHTEKLFFEREGKGAPGSKMQKIDR